MTKIKILKTSFFKLVFTSILLGMLSISCSSEPITEIEEIQQEEKPISADEDDLGKCSITGYDWLIQSPNNNGNWKLQYQDKEARRVGGNESFYDVANSRFDVVGSSCNRLRFRVQKGDATTSGSNNPRSELREMRRMSNGRERTAGWSYTSNKWIEIEFKVREMPTSGRLSVAQIHSGQDDISQISVDKKSNGRYKVQLYVEGLNGVNKKTLYNDASVNTTFKVRMKIENNRVKARRTSESSYGTSYEIKNTSKYRTNTCYFKAGAYLLGANSGQARVEFNKIKISTTQAY